MDVAEPVRLDGRKLEGGGQLVRIAVALSALTGQAVVIDNIRANRSGRKGLKASHLAAITTLAELSGSQLVKAQVGSCSVGFYPPPHEQGQQTPQIDSKIDIRLPTPGSVFLVFQALYPYLLHSTSADRIRVSIIGGTNVSSSPSFDYVSQVLIPNFARVGLPPLSVCLEQRGWATGHGQMGKVIFSVDSLMSVRRGNGGSDGDSPSHEIDLQLCRRRGTISKIDITVLAPDDHLDQSETELQSTKGKAKPGRSEKATQHHVDTAEIDKPETVREYMERYTHKSLRKRLKELPRAVFTHRSSEETDLGVVPVQTHTTEVTHRRSYMYVLIVAHTSTGFRIGRDALYGSLKDEPKPKKRQNKPRQDMATRVKGFVDECVDNFARELYDPLLQTSPDGPGTAAHQPCVDEYMRDQLVVLEALARKSGNTNQGFESREDERHWSLHTQTAQWVCQEMLRPR